MAETSVIPYGTQCGIGRLWHHMDWLLRVDVALLALLLAYTFVLILRVSRCYRLARHTGMDSSAGKVYVGKLRAHIRNLKSIASTATYLGLLGTCVGILSAFSGVGMQYQAFIAWFTSKITAALVPCAAGIVVAVPATCGYTYGGTRLDLLVKPSRNRLATRPFTEVTSFGLIAAWLLAILIRVYVIPFTPLPTYKGFRVGIAWVPCDTSERFIVLRISNRGAIFVNEEEQDWRSLQSRLSEIYRKRAYSVVYLSADEGVPFETVAEAIDTINSMSIPVQLVTPKAVNTHCPEPRLSHGYPRHTSR